MLIQSLSLPWHVVGAHLEGACWWGNLRAWRREGGKRQFLSFWSSQLKQIANFLVPKKFLRVFPPPNSGIFPSYAKMVPIALTFREKFQKTTKVMSSSGVGEGKDPPVLNLCLSGDNRAHAETVNWWLLAFLPGLVEQGSRGVFK